MSRRRPAGASTATGTPPTPTAALVVSQVDQAAVGPTPDYATWHAMSRNVQGI